RDSSVRPFEGLRMSVAPGPASSPASRPTSFSGFLQSLRSVLAIGSPGDWMFKQICQWSALVVILLVVLILALLSVQAWPAVKEFGLGFFTSDEWNGAELKVRTKVDGQWEEEVIRDYTTFGGLTFIYGSVMTSLVAMLLAVPLGVGTAAYLAEIAPG